MVDDPPWFCGLAAVLAVWRLAHLLAHEDGPFDVVLRLRRRAGDGGWGRLMDCPYCLSLWLALPAAAWLGCKTGATPADSAVMWLALSGGSCLIERALPGVHGDLPAQPAPPGVGHALSSAQAAVAVSLPASLSSDQGDKQ